MGLSTPDLYEQQVVDSVKRTIDYEIDELGATQVPRSVINSWRLININDCSTQESKKSAERLNSFASLFYFSLRVLKKNKLQTNPIFKHNLHYQMCQAVMKDGLKEVIEIPRDHYKSTIYSECFPIWRSLPFSNKDEDLILKIYDQLGQDGTMYVEWMRRAHNQDSRILVVSETIKNAAKLGIRVRNHYENGDLFRYLFSEVIPDASCIWTNESLQQKRTRAGSGHGEGTFDFIGVGAALQSRHYNIIIQDDLVGKDALKSELVMNDTIEYHKLLVGAFDADADNAGRDNDEIVVGNRWSYNDLNSHLRDNEKYFNFSRHSALGGCCDQHPHGIPIFPEAFNIAKLSRWRARLGTYLYSCQFLNLPINPEKCKFDTSRLRYFHYDRDYIAVARNDQRVDDQGRGYRVKMVHHIDEKTMEPAMEDVFPRNLQRYMIIDPNHSGQKGRCRHAITITGIQQKPRRIYLLRTWAKATDTNSFVETIFELATAFKINTIHIETVAAQKYLKFHLEYYIQANRKTKPEIAHIRFADLKSATTANAKIERIDSVIPIVEREELWLDSRDCSKVVEELEAYGNKNGLVDILDTLGYGPQVWKFDDVDDEELENLVIAQQTRFRKAMRMSA
jgi:hypothetical protein